MYIKINRKGLIIFAIISYVQYNKHSILHTFMTYKIMKLKTVWGFYKTMMTTMNGAMRKWIQLILGLIKKFFPCCKKHVYHHWMSERPRYFKKRSRKFILYTEFSSALEMAGVTVTILEYRLPSGDLQETTEIKFLKNKKTKKVKKNNTKNTKEPKKPFKK